MQIALLLFSDTNTHNYKLFMCDFKRRLYYLSLFSFNYHKTVPFFRFYLICPQNVSKMILETEKKV